MRKFCFIALLALLVPSLQSFADGDNQCVKRGLSEKLGIALEDVSLAESQNLPVYLSFPNSLVIGDELTFEVIAGGSPVLSESVELIEAENSDRAGKAGSATPVVEFLAGHEARLAYVHRLGERHNLEIRILQNGVEVETVAVADLLARSELLASADIAPLAHRSTVQIAATAPQQEMFSCVFNCGLDQNTCYDQCGVGDSYCLGICDSEFDECVHNCNGTCAPHTSTNTTYTLISLTPTSTYECHTSTIPGQTKGIFRLYTQLIKKTVTTTTTNLDCSETVTTQVSYFNFPCWIFQYSSPSCGSLGQLTNFC